jgi:nucleotide-binding universal stress UspA family protein
VRFATDEAARLGTGLTIVHSLPPMTVAGAHPGTPVPVDFPELVAAGRRRFDEAVAGWADTYPKVAITSHFSRQSPAWALVEASAGAALTVVGSRGHGGFSGLLLGSVSRHLLHHAAGPVAVVPIGRAVG